MTVVEIEYCVPCGLIDPAIELQRELLADYGRELDGVRLTTGHGGVFRVLVDGKRVFDKDEHGSLDRDAARTAVDERIGAA